MINKILFLKDRPHESLGAFYEETYCDANWNGIVCAYWVWGTFPECRNSEQIRVRCSLKRFPGAKLIQVTKYAGWFEVDGELKYTYVEAQAIINKFLKKQTYFWVKMTPDLI